MYTGETTLGGIENPFQGRVLGRNHVVGGREVHNEVECRASHTFFPGIRISQLRSRTDACSGLGESFSEQAVGESHIRCYGDDGLFTLDTEDRRPFGTCEENFEWDPFPAEKIRGVTMRGGLMARLTAWLQIYPDPAFPVILPNHDPGRAAEVLEGLERCSYIDLKTRFVVINANLYNPAMGE